MSDELRNNVLSLVRQERAKQQGLGFDANHDDCHTNGELAKAAAFFIVPGPVPLSDDGGFKMSPEYLLAQDWRDSPKINRSTHTSESAVDALSKGSLDDFLERRIRDIVKGIACGLAEVERLQRLGGVQNPEELPGAWD